MWIIPVRTSTFQKCRLAAHAQIPLKSGIRNYRYGHFKFHITDYWKRFTKNAYYEYLARRVANKSTSNALKSTTTIAVRTQVTRLTRNCQNGYRCFYRTHTLSLKNKCSSQSPSLLGGKEMGVSLGLRTPVHVAFRRRLVSSFFKKVPLLLHHLLLLVLQLDMLPATPLLLLQVVQGLDGGLPAHHPQLPVSPLPLKWDGRKLNQEKSTLPCYLEKSYTYLIFVAVATDMSVQIFFGRF